MRDFSVLSDVEFEELVGDLLGAEHDTLVERFAAGADGGIDLRWARPEGIHIAQCKHYHKSSFAQLLNAARKEAQKVRKLKPHRYLFVTTFDLSVSQKDRIHEIFESWMTGPGDVLGGKDVDALITRHSEVERRHPKLWVSTGMQLFLALHADMANRAEALRQRIEKSMPRYVVSPGYQSARDILTTHNVCLISGPPGIGKTTLAQMLIAEHISMGYEPVEVSADINEAWTALRRDHPQVFLYDDFLGQITFAERLPKNEDKRLSDIIEKFSAAGSGKKLILTTREYILRDAKLNYERLSDLEAKYHFVLELQAYSKADRAQILYNHLWHSDVGRACLREIAKGGYKEIISHRSYNPRLIEYCTGRAFDITSTGYPERFKATLDHPEKIWKVAFEKHLTLEQQLLVNILCTFPREARLDSLHAAHTSLCDSLGVISTGASFRESLDVLEGTFISLHKDVERNTIVRHLNPSVTEFALTRIAADPRIIDAIVRSAIFFDQLTEIFLYGRGGSFFRRGNTTLMEALGRNKDQFMQAMARTLDSRPLSQIEVQLGETPTVFMIDPPDKMENRIRFCLQVDLEWGIDPILLRSAIDLLISRWRTGTGDKASASRTLESLSQHSIGEDLLNLAHEALHTWFDSKLNDADDWYFYANHLSEYHGIHLVDLPDLALHFESFMDRQLLEGSSPYNLDEMKSLAEDFGLSVLSDRIEEAIREEYEPDDEYEPDGSRQSDEGDKGSDEYIADLFGRLGE
ncbi:restriction endonuclease [Streptomyces sp. NPDC057636]|uniref:nSTAND3 domain-containing NTPase n=1 Tax=Streptomyces sp. NPDC057636 TaxID=3346189 RepID=UPI0036CCB0A9